MGNVSFRNGTGDRCSDTVKLLYKNTPPEHIEKLQGRFPAARWRQANFSINS
ncbi:MAG: hypothetical protein JW863_02855 [Chitinispirillaceae bacterium]|nr:hypothetical protein [Chitinispirillaceae bacterium]